MKKFFSAAIVLFSSLSVILAQGGTAQNLKELAKSGPASASVQKSADVDEPGSDRTSSTDTLAARKFYDSGVLAYEGGKLDDAVGAFKAAGKLTPDDPQIHYMLGMTYAKSRSYKDSFDAFKRATRLKAEWPEAHYRLGVIAYVLGRRNQSLEAHNKLLKLDSQLAARLDQIIKQENTQTGAVQNLDASNWPAAPTKVAATRTLESSNNSASSNKAVTSSEDTSLSAIYRVGVGDVLDIRLLNSTTPRSTLYTVVDGGLIDLTVAGGPIVVAGLTTDEIQARIASELKRRAVEEGARVSVGVRQYASHSVIVTGLVTHPGAKFLRREAVPLYVVMAEAQVRNDASRITIMRTGAAYRTIDLDDQDALNVLVKSGDIINVTARPQEYYYIGGRINYPGQKVFQPGITLVQAILAAGGLMGDNDRVIELSREGADARLTTLTFRLKDIKRGKVQDPRLQPGDRIDVVR